MATEYASDYASYYSAASTAAQPYTLPKTREAEVPKIRRKAKAKVRMNNVLSVLLIGAVFMMVFRYTAITELNAKNEQLEASLREATAATDLARISLERTTDLNYVESVAKSQLGMDFPQNHQIVSVTLQYPDKAEIAGGSSGSIWRGVQNFFGGIWEYLY